MIIKLFSCVMIIVASAGIGSLLSSVLHKRARFLREFEKTLVFIQNTISYKNEPLLKTLTKICDMSKKDVGELFLLVHKEISESYNFYNRDFRNKLVGLLEKKILTREDIAVITDFFGDIGTYDKMHQIKSIDEIKKRLEVQLADAAKKAEDNSKIYTPFSVAVGIFICIVLI